MKDSGDGECEAEIGVGEAGFAVAGGGFDGGFIWWCNGLGRVRS